MSKVKKVSKISLKERLSQERQQGISAMEKKLRFLNEPTYHFEVGEEVQYGNLKNCIIKEVLYDGKAYGFTGKAISNNYGHPYTYQTYKVAPWMDIRPLSSANTSFASNQLGKLIFQNSTLENLLHLYYYMGIDMQPGHHREYDWDENHKELLIDSVFHNIEIGKIALHHLSEEERQKRHVSYEVIDGKQRLITLVDFYENKFQYNGKYYNELSWMDKRVFKNYSIDIATVGGINKKTVLKYFLMLNRTGRNVNKEHFEKIKKLLEEAEASDIK